MPVLSFDSRSTISGTNVCVNTWHVSVNGQPLISECNAVINAVNAFYNGFAGYRAAGSTVTTGTRVLYFQEQWWTKPTFDGNGNLVTRGKFNTEPFIMASASATSSSGSGSTAAAVAQFNTSATTLISAIHALTAAGALADLAVWSPTKGVLRPILTGASDATFDTMRSRVK
jgi:hypothetical protein